MTDRAEQLAAARELAVARFDREQTLTHLARDIKGYRFGHEGQARRMLQASQVTLAVLDTLPGERLADRWTAFEAAVWPAWLVGRDRPVLGQCWTWGAWALVASRLVRPDWPFISRTRTSQWVARLPTDDPLTAAHQQLTQAAAAARIGTFAFRAIAVNVGLRLLLTRGLDDLTQLTEADLLVPGRAKGTDILDVMLCQLGVVDRTPRRGIARRRTVERHAPAELARVAGVREPFLEVSGLYLATYARRLSDSYATLRHKAAAQGRGAGPLLALHRG